MKEILNKIKSRGYWEINIRPADFRKDRIAELEALKLIVTQCSVSLRGWSFPHISTKTDIQIGLDWMQQWVDWSDHVEAWRFYQSGQFVFYGSIRDDWRDQSFWGRPDEGWKPGTFLSVIDTIWHYTEIFEFAARLAMTDAGSESMVVSIVLHGLEGRQLQLDSPSRAGFDYPRICHIESFPQVIAVSRQELVAEPKLLALKASKELFIRFNWTPSLDLLRGIQDELGR